jgi:hypothetical protein
MAALQASDKCSLLGTTTFSIGLRLARVLLNLI